MNNKNKVASATDLLILSLSLIQMPNAKCHNANSINSDFGKPIVKWRAAIS